MADPDPSRPDLLAHVEQTRAQSHTLRAQVAELAEAVAEVELDVARVQEGIAEQGGRWLPRPESMPSGPGSSRRGSTPTRCACAGLRRTEACWPEGHLGPEVDARHRVTSNLRAMAPVALPVNRGHPGARPEARLITGNSIEVILTFMSWAYASGQRKHRLDAPTAAF
jgi:hypothetical protein